MRARERDHDQAVFTTINGAASRESETSSPEYQPSSTRRTRSAAEKLRILQAYDAAAVGSTERGALLRREGIYTSQISKWRKLRDRGLLGTLASQRRGPKAAPRAPLQAELEQLRKENARLQARLTRAEAIIEVQKIRQGNRGVQEAASAQRSSSRCSNFARL